MANRPEKTLHLTQLTNHDIINTMKSFSFAVILAITGIFAVKGNSAAAEVINTTTQAQAVNAEWLAYAPPPEEGAKAVCLIDTGVTLNPDTEGPVTYREATDMGDPSDLSAPDLMHGTGLAMVMAGPQNGWGTVGMWPSLKIVSVRDTIPGTAVFRDRNYEYVINRCKILRKPFGIITIEMALGGQTPSAEYTQKVKDTVVEAEAYEVSAVAAAGNTPGPLEFPAQIPDVLSVGGYDPSTGGLCSTSAYGADILAPGCSIDAAFPLTGEPSIKQGTSPASAFIATILTALRSYRPNLTRQQAEDLLLTTARETSAGKLVDVEALFHAAGLDTVVDAGKAATPQPSPIVKPPPSTNPPSKTELPTPIIKKISRNKDQIIVKTTPTKEDLTLIVQAFRGKRRKTVKSDNFTAKIRFKNATKLVCWYTFTGLNPSKKVTIGLPKRKARH